MATSDCEIGVSIKVHISLWDTLKLRIAGSGIRQAIEEKLGDTRAEEGGIKAEGIGDEVTEQLEKLSKAGLAPERTTEEVETIRLNGRTGKVEICAIGYISNEGPTKIWVDYDIDLLTQTLGMCPQCHASFSLLNFKKMFIGVKENQRK